MTPIPDPSPIQGEGRSLHMSTQPTRWRLDRQVSAAVLVTVFLQAAAALLWAGKAAARIDEMQRRLEAQAPVAERLARLEAQAESARQSLIRIEARLERGHER
ncbi:MAG: hypothetical protein B7Z12_08600 [Caulobacter vibrioides]|uniref:Uncharacterized protein n=1 Tax=Caulobacter vibrioides TaxID=155892 RepID=A0A258D8C8_CAUVI|nr:MAG: hypothetical protein B7Z12_08600 [Caulobacter vibrioides]